MPEAQLNDETMYMSFLARTKDGEFAPIEENSLLYLRIQEQTEVIENLEEDYYYCIS